MITWFARNHVAANLLMITIVVAGAFSLFGLRREMIPEMELDAVVVRVIYPGATPAEVEQAVVLRIEEAISDLIGIEDLSANAYEGLAVITLEVSDGHPVRVLLDDVKARVDAITTFPEDVERPTVDAPVLRREVMTLQLSGPFAEAELRRLAELVRDDLLLARREPQGFFERLLNTVNRFNDGTMTQIALVGVRDHEIAIELREADLRRYGLSFEEVAAAVRISSFDLPAGSVRRRSGEILLRTLGQADDAPAVADLILRSDATGATVRLGDVATVRDGFAEQDVRATVDGETAVGIEISRVGDQDILAIAEVVHRYVNETAASRLPEPARLIITNDASRHFRERVDTLRGNAVLGLVLVFVTLGLFLRLRLAFWVSMGIPMSFLGALWAIPHFDGSLNMISMFAFIMVLGIVVDDAIIVGESVYAAQEGGKRNDEGAVAGTLAVARPVIFAVLTSIIAFAPMLFLSGLHGRFWRIIPVVVIACLAFSLVESLLVLPAHLSRPGRETTEVCCLTRWIRALQDWVTALLRGFMARIYEPVLQRALSWRYLTLSCFVAAVIVSGGMIGGGFVRFLGFPALPGDSVRAVVEMPNGTHREVTWAVLERLEAGLEALRQEYDADHSDTPLFGRRSARLQGAAGGEVQIELLNTAERGIGAEAVQRRWRAVTGELPGVRNLSFYYQMGRGSRNSDITVELAGDDLAQLEEAAAWLIERLHAFEGVFNITDTFSDGKDELVLRIRPEAEALGLRLGDLARQVRAAFHGIEVQRLQRGRDEVRVMVRYPEEDRRSLAVFDDMRIRGGDGRELPFHSVALVERGVGYPTILRQERRRVVRVSCEVDPLRGDTNTITGDLATEHFPVLREAFPGIAPAFEGSTRQLAESMAELRTGFVLALLAMWALLAVAFRSYWQPMLVLSAIPFGIIGAIVGHFLLGYDLTLLSFMGIVALAGVVDNDSLVLIDAINTMVDDGMPVREALVRGGRLRFRAILLTTLTTFLGLLPLLLETSLQARFLIPMAISLAFGVLFATVITLILVPTLYLILDDCVALRQRLFGAKPDASARDVQGDGSGL